MFVGYLWLWSYLVFIVSITVHLGHGENVSFLLINPRITNALIMHPDYLLVSSLPGQISL